MKLKRSRLSGRTSARLIEHFIVGTPARTAADLVDVNRNTAISFYHRLRQIITDHRPSVDMFFGEIEIDGSYFGGNRKGIHSRDAAGKVPVFGILKRDGKVYTQVLPNMKASTFLKIVNGHVQPNGIVTRIACPLTKRFVEERYNHINGIENFWNQAKRHLRKYNGIPKEHFPLYLKECEFRFNYGMIAVRFGPTTW